MKGKNLVKKIGAGLGALVFALGLNSCTEKYTTSKHRFDYFFGNITEYKSNDTINYITNSSSSNGTLKEVVINGNRYNNITSEIYRTAEKRYMEMIGERDSVMRAKNGKNPQKRSSDEERDLEVLKY